MMVENPAALSDSGELDELITCTWNISNVSSTSLLCVLKCTFGGLLSQEDKAVRPNYCFFHLIIRLTGAVLPLPFIY